MACVCVCVGGGLKTSALFPSIKNKWILKRSSTFTHIQGSNSKVAAGRLIVICGDLLNEKRLMLTAPLLYQQSEFHIRKHTFCRGGSKRSRCFILLYLAKQKANYRPRGDTKDPGYIRAAILWNGILLPRNCSSKIHTRIQISFFFYRQGPFSLILWAWPTPRTALPRYAVSATQWMAAEQKVICSWVVWAGCTLWAPLCRCTSCRHPNRSPR